MHIILLIIAIITLLIIFLLTQNQYISMDAGLDGGELSADIYWLRPLLKVHVQFAEKTVISIFLFKLRIHHSAILKTKVSKWRKRLIKSVEFSHIEIDTEYCLHSPFLIAMIYGIVSFIMSLSPAKIERITQHPNFFTENQYVHVFASGYLSLGHTIKNYLN